MNKRPLFFGVTALAVAFPVLAVASPVTIPNAFEDGDPIVAEEFNENFDAIADAINDNDARIAALEEGAAGGGVPQGTIAFFATGTCPEGWAEYADLRGRVPVGLAQGGMVAATVGDALDAEGTVEFSELPSHTHSIDPPSTMSTSESAHTHQVNPPQEDLNIAQGGTHTHALSGDGAHVHNIRTEASGNQDDSAVMGTFSTNPGGNYNSGPFGNDSGGHTHTVTSTNSAHSHTGTVDIPTFGSQPGSAHSHSVNIAPFGSAANAGGVASVDVTMPYIQLLACEKL